MNRHRLILTICTLLAGVAARAQEPSRPAPPVPPTFQDDIDAVKAQVDILRSQIDTEARDSIREQLEVMKDHRFELNEIHEKARIKAETANDIARTIAGKFSIEPGLAFVPQATVKWRTDRRDNPDRAYERGQRALDSRHWDEALDMFSEAAGSGGSRVDGALYWKAYALMKLGRRDEALAAIAELRKSYAGSRWLDDAKALELEVKQASGQKVSPEAENDEDLKLMALNGLVQSDPERALPLLENLLKTSSSPKLKERVIFVLAESSAPRAKQLLEQVARGGAGNPDMQLKAIRYVAASSKRTDNRALLWEIYSGSNDTQVKRAALNGLMSSRDKDHVLQVARTEKSTPLRLEAISFLGSTGAQAELWQIYQGETSTEVKQQILHSMTSTGSADRLVEIAKIEKEPKLRRSAIHALGSMGATRTGDALVSMYGSETDPELKRTIVDSLNSQRNAKALVDLARKESDPAMKREIVGRLSHMKSKEASDYLMELLK